MVVKLKNLIIVETILILILIITIINIYEEKIELEKKVTQIPSEGLLSPRVYSGLIEPRSFLIENLDPLKGDINRLIKEKNLNVSVYIENLRTGTNIGIDENERFFPFSLTKIPIAILLMQDVEAGKISLDTVIPIRDEDRSPTYGELYKNNVSALPLRALLEKMLIESDNTAARTLTRFINKKDLKLLSDYYNINLNFYYNSTEKDENDTNLVTAKTMSNIFTSLYLSTVLKAEDSEYLLSLLKNSTYDIKKSANLPDNITIVHKFGEYYNNDIEYFHDCGIIYIDKSRVLYCIMTKDMDEKQAKNTTELIINRTYNYILITRNNLKTYKDEDLLSFINRNSGE